MSAAPPSPTTDLDVAAAHLYYKMYGWWASIAECQRPANFTSGRSTDNLTFFTHWLVTDAPADKLATFLAADMVEMIEVEINAHPGDYASPPEAGPGDKYLNYRDLDMADGATLARASANLKTALAAIPDEKRKKVLASFAELEKIGKIHWDRDPGLRGTFNRDFARFSVPPEEWEGLKTTAGVSEDALEYYRKSRAQLDKLLAAQPQ